MRRFAIWLYFIVFSLTAQNSTFSVDRLIQYYDWALDLQNIYVQKSMSPLPGPPQQKSGWVLFSISNQSNNSQIQLTNTYLVVKGLDPATGLPCYVSFDANGVGTVVDASASTVAGNYTYLLSYFPENNGTPYLYVPPITSARLYISLNHKLVLPVVKNINGIYTITDPSPTVTTDPAYYYLYDKVEFNIQPNQCVINPTLVDFFSIPLPITVTANNGCNNLYGGIPPTQNREAIFTGFTNTINSTVSNSNAKTQWSNLLLTGFGKNLRILSTNTAVNAAPALFDPQYLLSATYGLDWMTQVWSTYYEANPIWMDLSQLTGYHLYSGQVNPSTGVFLFTPQSGAGTNVSIALPTSSAPFFAGTGFTILSGSDGAAAPIIEKFLSAGFESGILPYPSSSANPINNSFYQSKSNSYYTNSSYLPASNGTWYDLYSKVLHSYAVYPYNYYTYAYDDVLGADNTITSDNILLNPIQITITIGDMNGTNVIGTGP